MPAIKKHESFTDFVTREMGAVSAMFLVANNNNLSITDDVAPGTNLIVDKAAFQAIYKGLLKKTVTVKPYIPDVQDQVLQKHQNNIDFVCQHAGTLEWIFEMALLNGISVTEIPVPGSRIKVKAIDTKTVAAFIGKEYNIMSNPDVVGGVIVFPPGGIGYMKIESTFKVS